MSVPIYPSFIERTPFVADTEAALNARMISRQKAGVPASAANEVQGIYPLGTVSGGNFKLGNISLAAGGTGITASIPWNATATTIRDAINALSPAVPVISSLNSAVTISGFKALALTFTTYAPQNMMTVDSTGITGGGSVAIMRLVAGTSGDFPTASLGDLAMDSTTGDLYINKGAVGVPTWTPHRLIIPVHVGNDTVAALGDSITAANASDFVQNMMNNYVHIAAYRSKGRFSAVRVAGVGGDTTAQMLARIADVIYPRDPYTGVLLPRPRYCAVLGGVNDIQQSLTVGIPTSTAGSTTDNLKNIYTTLRNNGIEPIACLVVPYGNATQATQDTNQQRIGQLNAWITWYCRWWLPKNGQPPIKVVDFYSPMIDPTTGRTATALNSGDLIHPSPAGYDVMGQVLCDRLMGSGTYAHAGVYLASCTNDWTGIGPSVIPNGTMVDTNADGTADSWSIVAGNSIAAIDAPDLGNYQVISNTGNQTFVSSRSSTMVAGDRIAVAAIIKSTVTAGQTPQQLMFFGGADSKQNSITRSYGASVPVGSREIYVGDVPAGASGFNYIVRAAAASAVSIGQLTAVNLTTLGLA